MKQFEFNFELTRKNFLQGPEFHLFFCAGINFTFSQRYDVTVNKFGLV